MPKSVTLDQQQPPYRRTSRSNSPSTSSIVTVRPTDSSRSRSGTRMASKASNTSSDDAKTSSKRPASSSTRLSSSGTTKYADKTGSDGVGHYSRWSQSSNSSHATNEHRRHSSFSKRFSLGGGSSQNPSSYRTPSPSKKRRPADIQTAPSGIHVVTSASPSGPLSVPGGLVTHKFLDSASDGPRTPLLYMGQISSTDDMGIDSQSVAGQRTRDDSSRDATSALKPPAWGTNLAKSSQTASEKSYQARSQQRSESTRSSSGSQNQSSSPTRSKPRKDRDKDKKSMLSRALQRANEAVQLDNSQDYLGAVEAYEEACEYLGQVLNRTSSEEDRRKLSTIRTTYSSRIEELQQLDSQWRLPETENNLQNDSTHSREGSETQPSLDGAVDDDAAPVNDTVTTTNAGDSSSTTDEQRSSGDSEEMERLISSIDHDGSDPWAETVPSIEPLQSSFRPTDATRLAPPTGSDMPPPLSPRRPPPPVPTDSEDAEPNTEIGDDYDPRRESHLIGAAAGSYGTWLDNGQESPGLVSRSSSHHSVSSINGLRRRHLRTHSTNTEAEFDAALDAAVEAAYDEGYEPYTEERSQPTRDYMARASMIESPARPDEFFEQRKSIIAAANAHVAQFGKHQSVQFSEPRSSMDSEAEERLLDEATQNYLTDDRNLDSQPKTTLPRQSDSSSSSGRTWGSSVASSLNTTGTSLTTVNEYAPTPAANVKQQPTMPPPAPPPTSALPLVPTKGKVPPPLVAKSTVSHNLPTLALPQSPSVQERRSFSNQGAKKLKIETATVPQPHLKPGDHGELTLTIPKRAPTDPPAVPPKPGSATAQSENGPSPDTSSQGPSAPSSFRLISSPFPTPFQCKFPEDISSNVSPPTPGLNSAFSHDSGSIRPSPQSASPINPFQQARSIDRGLLKSHSSLSLRQKGLITPEAYDTSPGTPMSFTFSGAPALGRAAPPNTSAAATFGAVPPPVNNVNLFANEIHASDAPTLPEPQVPYPPRPLEPCPTSDLLRPFWLMRRFYQTVAHPRGGYLTNKVFIPREVWKVKNVKLKNVDDKIANCDLLTAALLKLGAVDTLDADAVLEEMQTFESILDQAQTNLSKKLGNDVGVQNVSALFKDAPATTVSTTNNTRSSSAGDTSSGGANGGGSKSNSKSYLSSWRKLRSKNSSAALNSHFPTTRETSSKESVTMSTVPMTGSWPGATNRITKRDYGLGGGDVKTDGPNAPYMSALARLCDAVQVLDQIARQVEDPGLKHSSPTHVGLELSSRHAAEFFGFYICRFVLQDIMMLAEKFVKRASEWVLA